MNERQNIMVKPQSSNSQVAKLRQRQNEIRKILAGQNKGEEEAPRPSAKAQPSTPKPDEGNSPKALFAALNNELASLNASLEEQGKQIAEQKEILSSIQEDLNLIAGSCNNLDTTMQLLANEVAKALGIGKATTAKTE